MLVFETPNQEKAAEYEVELMDLDAEHLEKEGQKYSCLVKMPSGESARICWDFNLTGDALIACAKIGWRFLQVENFLEKKNVKFSLACNVNKEEKTVTIETEKLVPLAFFTRALHCLLQ